MRVTQNSGFLLSLFNEVAAGRVLPAAMQRPYVWRKADVEALCDSILSGFPIGAFLSWTPEAHFDLADLAKGRLGPVTAARASDRPSRLLLDGQNRLATLAWMLHDGEGSEMPEASDAERDTWLGAERLVLDFGTRSLRFVPADEAQDGLRVPAWTLFPQGSDSAGQSGTLYLMQRLRRDLAARFPADEIRAFLAFYDECCGAFRDARITETVIEQASPAEARHAFLRICRVGVPMAQEDFDRAIGWVPVSLKSGASMGL